jgi:hypothetical protein
MSYLSLQEVEVYTNQFFEIYAPQHDEVVRENFADPSHKELCIFLQLHNDKITPELLNYVDEISQYIPAFDVYATVLSDRSAKFVQEQLSSRKWVDSVKRVDVFRQNRGMDIGAFLWQLDQVRKVPHEYAALLKFHTKSAHGWRREMMLPFTTSHIAYHVQHIKQNPEVGIMGVSSRMYVNNEYGEARFLRDMEKKVFGRFSNPGERGFIGGSVFLVNYKYLCEMMKEEGLREYIEDCYNKAPIGWCADHIPHAFERFIAYYLSMKNKKILGVK